MSYDAHDPVPGHILGVMLILGFMGGVTIMLWIFSSTIVPTAREEGRALGVKQGTCWTKGGQIVNGECQRVQPLEEKH